MKTSETIVELAKALCSFQAEVTDPKLDGTNPHFSSKFSTLSETIKTVRPTLTKHGISFIQPVRTEDGQVGVSTMLIHTSGEFIHSDVIWIPLPKANAQGVGAAITYGRRFSLGATLGLANEEDDDGNSISDKNKGGQQSQPPNNYSKNNNTTKTSDSNNNTFKPITDGQKKAVNAAVGEFAKLSGKTSGDVLAAVENTSVGKFGDVKAMSAGQASNTIALVNKWIKDKKAAQGGTQ